MELDEKEQALRRKLEVIGPAARTRLLRILALWDYERAAKIGEYWSNSQTRAFAELLIDLEVDPGLRRIFLGMLREIEA